MWSGNKNNRHLCSQFCGPGLWSASILTWGGGGSCNWQGGGKIGKTRQWVRFRRLPSTNVRGLLKILRKGFKSPDIISQM